MLYRLKNETYIAEKNNETFIVNNEMCTEMSVSQSGVVFVRVLSHIPQPLDILVDKIYPQFIGVDKQVVMSDAAAFFDELASQGLLVKGETRIECNRAEYDWRNDIEISTEENIGQSKAYFHLPGLFSHYNFYKKFLPIFYNYREFFYPWAAIGSIYGSPAFAIWNSGRARSRAGKISADIDDVLHLLGEYDISGRFTFSNSLLTEVHLSDTYCNFLLRKFHSKKNGIIIASSLLQDYIAKNYPDYYFVSSTTKCLNTKDKLLAELSDQTFRFVVPDYNFNNDFDVLSQISENLRSKAEFLCDESCMPRCPVRPESYARISRSSLFMDDANDACFFCPDKRTHKKYFSRIKKNRTFIGVDLIKDKYLSMGFKNFKLEGREYGELRLLEEILYFMVKPEHHLDVREMLYLNPYVDFPIGCRP